MGFNKVYLLWLREAT